MHRRGRGGGSGGGGGGGGRGRKSAARKAQDKATLAAFMAKRYPGQSKLAAQAGSGGGNSSTADAEDVQCIGERTREERDAELRDAAISVDEDE